MNVYEVKESILMALAALKANKMRSFLTILGVLIGVTAVIGMVSIIQGLNTSMARQIESLGSNSIWVTRFEVGIQFGRLPEEIRNRKPITYEDAMAVEELCPSVAAVSPQNWGPGRKIAKYKNNENTRFELIGILPAYEEVNNNYIKEGRFITDTDVHYKARVAVLGQDVKEKLFPHIDPIGKRISLGGSRFAPKKFTVIGVMEERPSILGESQNNFILLPYDTYMTLYPEEKELLLVAKPELSSSDQRHLSGYGGYLLHWTNGGWCGGDEYHVGFGYRENQRDWNSQGHRCQKKGYPVAVSGGGDDPFRYWWGIGNHSRFSFESVHRSGHSLGFRDSRFLDLFRLFCGCFSRPDLRDLSSFPGNQSRSHRILEI